MAARRTGFSVGSSARFWVVGAGLTSREVVLDYPSLGGLWGDDGGGCGGVFGGPADQLLKCDTGVVGLFRSALHRAASYIPVVPLYP